MEKTSSPLLTIAIPAYNVEQTVQKALSTFLQYSPEQIEVLVINDGSTDQTKKIVADISKQYPVVRLINKANGGHGSTINLAIQKAKGKYFKLLDGDDWIDKKLFAIFIKRLEKETADIVLTEHVEVLLKNGKEKLSHDYDNIKPYKVYEINKTIFKKYGPTLPNTTIKTSILKKSQFLIDENCFYVDQEYNYISYAFSNTLIKYNLPLYYYRLEQDNQSMSVSSLKKNVFSHEKVCLRLITETKSNLILTKPKLNHLYQNIILPLCNLQYEIAIKHCKSRKAFLSFDNKLKKYPDIYYSPLVSGNIIKLHRITKGFTLPIDPFLNRLALILKKTK